MGISEVFSETILEVTESLYDESYIHDERIEVNNKELMGRINLLSQELYGLLEDAGDRAGIYDRDVECAIDRIDEDVDTILKFLQYAEEE